MFVCTVLQSIRNRPARRRTGVVDAYLLDCDMT